MSIQITIVSIGKYTVLDFLYWWFIFQQEI